MKERVEILVSGFGGQGVVRLGQILGEAAVRQNFRVTMLKSHGTEQRGGYVRTQVVISTQEIDNPGVEEPDYFIALSAAGYNAYRSLLRDGAILYEPAYIHVDNTLPLKQIAIPAKELAMERLGKEMFGNSIMLGAMTKIAGFFDKKNMLQTLLDIMPRFREENEQAFEIGYNFASDL